MAGLLRSSLERGLPGLAAQMEMVPRDRAMTGLPVGSYRRAAVLIAMYPADDDWRLPLILRTRDGRVHSGQVSLPGGRLKAGETDEEGALREVREEVGLEPSKLEVIGKLSPVPIPVSRHLVVPVLGLIKDDGMNNVAPGQAQAKAPVACSTKYRRNDEILPWPVRLQKREVQDLFTIELGALVDPRLRYWEMRKTVAGPMKVPYFAFGGHKVWGATAIILAELSSIFQSLGFGIVNPGGPSSTK